MTDDMARWVCAIGGYEFLASDNPDIVQAAKEWLLRYGGAHKPIKGTGLDVVRRYHAAQHYGFGWWGSPREWVPSLLWFFRGQREGDVSEQSTVPPNAAHSHSHSRAVRRT